MPYRLSADARVEPGRLWIDLINTGGTGAVFQVFDAAGAAGPWRFTVGAGERHAAGHWNRAGPLEAYDQIVHGPDGFYRRFAGRTDQGLSITLTETAGAEVVLHIANSGVEPRRVELAMDEPYRVAGGEARRRSVAVGPGQSAQVAWNLAANDHWYSLTAHVEALPQFLRRFAGRVATGRAGRTDPGIGLMRL